MPSRRPRRIRRRTVGNQQPSFTPRKRNLLYRAIEAGLPYNRACEICGVPRSSFGYWMSRGKTDPEHSPYVAFRRYIKRIEARKEKELLEVIDMVAKGNYKIRETEITFSEKGRSFKRKTKVMKPEWKAAAWRLERKYRDDYGAINPDQFKDKTPEEIAREIRDATMALRSSVPTEEEADL